MKVMNTFDCEIVNSYTHNRKVKIIKTGNIIRRYCLNKQICIEGTKFI